ncbi:MAG TPA: helix-turn-helix domain-containing protein [Caulobacterales bacterium]|nr:helix-turn-helix domain-containing protein [Caulobacterales bacterium]
MRPRAYAAIELLLDLVYIAQTLTGLDLESTMICFCVAEATARPVIEAIAHEPALRTIAQPPEERRGAISRLLIADRTGLPRETVRRKVKALVERGWLLEDSRRRVRIVANLADPATQKTAHDTFAAVRRYNQRLRGLGVAGIGEDD